MRPYAVIGIGRFGLALAETLTRRGAEVLAIDSDPEIVDEIRDRVAQAVCLDATDEAAMRAAGIDAVEVAIVGIGEKIEVSILATALLRKIGVPRIIGRALSELHGTILAAVGATKVIRIEAQAGVQLAQSLMARDIREAIPLASGHSIAEVFPRPEFIGRTIRDLDLRRTYGLNVVAVKRRVPRVDDEGRESYDEEVNDLPRPEDVVEGFDVLIVVGSDENIERLARG